MLESDFRQLGGGPAGMLGRFQAHIGQLARSEAVFVSPFGTLLPYAVGIQSVKLLAAANQSAHGPSRQQNQERNCKRGDSYKKRDELQCFVRLVEARPGDSNSQEAENGADRRPRADHPALE